ncbi:MarR family winged helix-turn-helix transcriptional regulator [Microlunatus flavus]|uniref:DNA-binding transcriptional regulator, MarR family n=1 Tax=Microlunatus flavus TaxID=1036181 RepID=A0A1H9D3Y9_9ACTN|nr:MarR family winged helix-turn-helix transcriptional regulator [Microlunatus flavus]SEQ08210.1 DNA-binding transcriptional regulator, MarR family [Microlunatus flavus]
MRRGPRRAVSAAAPVPPPGGAHRLRGLRADPLGPQEPGQAPLLVGGTTPRPGRAQSPGLDDQLCFALYAATNAVIRAYRPLLQAVGLTYPEYVVLMALWEADDVSVADVSARTQMPLGDLSPIVERLVETELVMRHGSRLRRGATRLTLTDRGRLLEERAVVAQHEVRCQTRLSTDDVAQLRGSLHDLTGTLQAAHPYQEAGTA